MKRLIVLVSMLAGCVGQTSFTGSPIVPGGRPGCEERCASYGMQLVGMVHMGESYTDGCICGVPGQPGVASCNAAAAAPAIAGVIIQKQREEQQRQQQQNMRQP